MTVIDYLNTLPKDYKVLTTEVDYTDFSVKYNVAVLNFNKSIVIGSI